MKYIVDTCVWSLALRRKPPTHDNHPLAVNKLNTLLEHGERIFLIGIILQEILQGIRNKDQFAKVADALSYFPMLEESKDIHLLAAELFNTCRAKGVQASTIDFLITAAAIKNDCVLLTIDKDFERISKHADLQLL